MDSPYNLPIEFVGPPLSEGPLPAFFYFALSAEESLHLDPFNQPVTYLKDQRIRCFSFTLPFHGPGFDNTTAIERWEQEIKIHPHFLEDFFHNCLKNIEYLIQQGLIDTNKMAIGGLSRGAFVATHLAARDPRLKYVLGFAPMTMFPGSEGIDKLIPKLVNHHFRFYIGNHDLRVGTEACFIFIYQLADAAFQQGHRSPPMELIITPSVGYKGHGTLPPAFKAGSEWIIEKLLSK